MFEPIPKPHKDRICPNCGAANRTKKVGFFLRPCTNCNSPLTAEPKRKTPLLPYKLDKNGVPILAPPRAPNPPKGKISRFLCADCGEINQKIGKIKYDGCATCGSMLTRPLPLKLPENKDAVPVVKAKHPKWYRRDPLWEIARRLWFEQNPPDLAGEYYQCRLCPYAVHKDETTLDHREPKGSHPELKYILSNLQPAHGECNQRKGSMSMEAYEKIYGIGGINLALSPA